MNVFHPAILYVDDEQANLNTFKRAFGSDFEVKCCLSAEEALNALAEGDYPLIVADQRMPGMSGIELCEKLFLTKPETVRIILTAYTDTQVLLDAIHRGHVHDYIVKPWKKEELKPILEEAFEDYKQKVLKLRELELRAARADSLEAEVRASYDTDGIIGKASGLKAALEVVEKAAPTDSTILVLGETGTGKELVARMIHQRSKRRGGPFIPVNCVAFAKNLLESELFGHEKGAFTGAHYTRLGRFEMAHGGTLFLDEVGEMPEEIQVKLLRVLQERKIQRIGGNRIVPVNVRLIAATNRNLEQDAQQGHFRQDLYYRLDVVSIKLPPLRERKEDIPELAEYFLQKYSRRTGKELRLSEASLAHLARYDWPGNVRELENIIERAVILSPGPAIEPSDLNHPLSAIAT